MAVELEVFLLRANLPSFSEWAEAISKAGFPLTFPRPVNLTQHKGYLPAVLLDEESGFEFDVLDIAETEKIPDEVLALGLHPDAIAGFRFHETDECDAATIGAAVLASLAQGVFHDPQEGEACSGKDALTKAKKQLRASTKEKNQEAAKPHGRLKPAQWAKVFEQTLRQVHPDYTLSKEYCGRVVECTRKDESGLVLSQNCVKLYDTYHQCFAILLPSRKLIGGAYTPFVIGSRFDHNATVSMAYYHYRDYRGGRKRKIAPKEWHSDHRATERGAREWVGSCTRSAEQFLFPFYINCLCQGAERMTLLLRSAADFIEQWQVSEETLRQPPAKGEFTSAFAAEFHLKDSPDDWEDLLEYYNALRMADIHGFSGSLLLQYRHATMNTTGEDIARATGDLTRIPPEIRNAAIFTAYARDFLTAREELTHIISVIENLEPRDLPPVPGQVLPWWRFW